VGWGWGGVGVGLGGGVGWFFAETRREEGL
jgi:hypothetical protein